MGQHQAHWQYRPSDIQAAVIINSSFTFCVLGSAVEEFCKDEVIQSVQFYCDIKRTSSSHPFFDLNTPFNAPGAAAQRQYLHTSLQDHSSALLHSGNENTPLI